MKVSYYHYLFAIHIGSPQWVLGFHQFLSDFTNVLKLIANFGLLKYSLTSMWEKAFKITE
jgi:hypothetical protein